MGLYKGRKMPKTVFKLPRRLLFNKFINNI